MKSVGFIIDDDRDAVELLTLALLENLPDLAWRSAVTAEDAFILLKKESPDVVLLDLALNTRGVDSGYELLGAIVSKYPGVRVIVLTGHSDIEYGIRAIANGAAHFITKPADLSHLIVLIKDALQQTVIRKELIRLNGIATEKFLVGESEQAKKLRLELSFAASHNKPVLLVGETGTGKGVAARSIHLASNRKNFKLVRYQPNFASGDIVQSELFGHLKGAFTGALSKREGLVAEARGGTLFLDEIDELPQEIQITLLNVLQEQIYRSVGADKELKSDFRLIAATNQNLEFLLKNGKLRSDLYHRISFTTIELPPLRERIVDLRLLVDFFLNRLREQEELAVFSIEQLAYAQMQQYSWPGNIRELQTVVENAAYKAAFVGRAVILSEDLNINVAQTNAAKNFNEKVEGYKRTLIQEALNAVDGNQLKAAELLQLDRSTLRRILDRSKQAYNLR